MPLAVLWQTEPPSMSVLDVSRRTLLVTARSKGKKMPCSQIARFASSPEQPASPLGRSREIVSQSFACFRTASRAGVIREQI